MGSSVRIAGRGTSGNPRSVRCVDIRCLRGKGGRR